jgi:hypothetical protein
VTVRSPRTTALLDQADAAGRPGERIMAQFAELLGGELREGLPVGPRRGRPSPIRAENTVIGAAAPLVNGVSSLERVSKRRGGVRAVAD